MPTLKPAGLLLAILFFNCTLFAQDKLNVKFGKVKPEDFQLTSVLIDSSTNAVVVADVGKSTFASNPTDMNFSLIFTQKKRIKIINKNGFGAATITIPLYVSDEGKAEKLEDLDAFTYNLENGKVVQIKVDKSSVFTEKHSKNWIYKKFTFPALKEGSILEYSCQVKSDFFFNLQSWTFQGEYPVLWSQYEAGIPEFFRYITTAQGYQPFVINKIDKSQVSYSFLEHVDRTGGGLREQQVSSGSNNFKLDGAIDYHTWVMKNVPALKEEAYTTTLRNSIAKIEFQLNQIAFPNTIPKEYTNTWEKVSEELRQNEEFGMPINRPNNWLDNDVEAIVKNAVTQKEKAEKIFNYVSNNFSCTDLNRIYISDGLKSVLKNKSGSVADINMLLIAMLKTQKIGAIPVILSTRDNGFTHEIYPFVNRYNYLVVKIVADNEIYFLDATVKRLPFGRLPSKVYNGQAREITNSTAMPVYFIADSLKESNATAVYISNLEKGGVEGSFQNNMGFYKSLSFRNKSATSTDDFKKSLKQEFTDEIEVNNVNIGSLEALDKPVQLNFDLKFKSFGESDIVYFTPMLGEAIKKNPFTAAERFYPIEMPYTVDDIFTLTMEVPKGYTVDEMPKSARVALNDNEGMFEYLTFHDEKNIQVRCRLVLKKANYLNEDYQSMRDFYTFIVKKEAEQIVFKKIK